MLDAVLNSARPSLYCTEWDNRGTDEKKVVENFYSDNCEI